MQKKSKKTSSASASQGAGAPTGPFSVGEKVIVRTVTMIDVGRIVAIGDTWLKLEDGGWVADTGRFSEMLATGDVNEFERAPSWFVVFLGAGVDAFPWSHDLPQKTK